MEHAINEREYCLGYNHADLLHTFAPDLLSDIDTSQHTEDDYLLGFYDRQQMLEKKDSTLDELQEIRSRTRDRGKELDLEME